MRRDTYQTYIGDKGVAFAWIAAAFGPSFIVIGLEPDYRAHLVISIISLILVFVSIFDGVRAFKAKSWSGVVVYSLVPVILLLVSVVFALDG